MKHLAYIHVVPYQHLETTADVYCSAVGHLPNIVPTNNLVESIGLRLFVLTIKSLCSQSYQETYHLRQLETRP